MAHCENGGRDCGLAALSLRCFASKSGDNLLFRDVNMWYLLPFKTAAFDALRSSQSSQSLVSLFAGLGAAAGKSGSSGAVS